MLFIMGPERTIVPWLLSVEGLMTAKDSCTSEHKEPGFALRILAVITAIVSLACRCVGSACWQMLPWNGLILSAIREATSTETSTTRVRRTGDQILSQTVPFSYLTNALPTTFFKDIFQTSWDQIKGRRFECYSPYRTSLSSELHHLKDSWELSLLIQSCH